MNARGGEGGVFDSLNLKAIGVTTACIWMHLGDSSKQKHNTHSENNLNRQATLHVLFWNNLE